jgi:hypothetical protein
MNEGSKVLRLAITGILGVVIVRNSIEEQISSCILAMPAKPTATASSPIHPFSLHIDPDPLPLLRIGQLTGTFTGVSLAFGELTDATPQKDEQLHLERKDLEPDLGMPFLLRTAAANFMNSQYVPERRQFIQPEQASNMIVLKPPCPDKDKAPLHLEPEEPGTVAVAPPEEDSPWMPTPHRQQLFAQPQFYDDGATYAPIMAMMRKPTLVTVLTHYPEAPKEGTQIKATTS